MGKGRLVAKWIKYFRDRKLYREWKKDVSDRLKEMRRDFDKNGILRQPEPGDYAKDVLEEYDIFCHSSFEKGKWPPKPSAPLPKWFKWPEWLKFPKADAADIDYDPTSYMDFVCANAASDYMSIKRPGHVQELAHGLARDMDGRLGQYRTSTSGATKEDNERWWHNVLDGRADEHLKAMGTMCKEELLNRARADIMYYSDTFFPGEKTNEVRAQLAARVVDRMVTRGKTQGLIEENLAPLTKTESSMPRPPATERRDTRPTSKARFGVPPEPRAQGRGARQKPGAQVPPQRPVASDEDVTPGATAYDADGNVIDMDPYLYECVMKMKAEIDRMGDITSAEGLKQNRVLEHMQMRNLLSDIAACSSAIAEVFGDKGFARRVSALATVGVYTFDAVSAITTAGTGVGMIVPAVGLACAAFMAFKVITQDDDEGEGDAFAQALFQELSDMRRAIMQQIAFVYQSIMDKLRGIEDLIDAAYLGIMRGLERVEQRVEDFKAPVIYRLSNIEHDLRELWKLGDKIDVVIKDRFLAACRGVDMARKRYGDLSLMNVDRMLDTAEVIENFLLGISPPISQYNGAVHTDLRPRIACEVLTHTPVEGLLGYLLMRAQDLVFPSWRPAKRVEKTISEARAKMAARSPSNVAIYLAGVENYIELRRAALRHDDHVVRRYDAGCEILRSLLYTGQEILDSVGTLEEYCHSVVTTLARSNMRTAEAVDGCMERCFAKRNNDIVRGIKEMLAKCIGETMKTHKELHEGILREVQVSYNSNVTNWLDRHLAELRSNVATCSCRRGYNGHDELHGLDAVHLPVQMLYSSMEKEVPRRPLFNITQHRSAPGDTVYRRTSTPFYMPLWLDDPKHGHVLSEIPATYFVAERLGLGMLSVTHGDLVYPEWGGVPAVQGKPLRFYLTVEFLPMGADAERGDALDQYSRDARSLGKRGVPVARIECNSIANDPVFAETTPNFTRMWHPDSYPNCRLNETIAALLTSMCWRDLSSHVYMPADGEAVYRQKLAQRVDVFLVRERCCAMRDATGESEMGVEMAGLLDILESERLLMVALVSALGADEENRAKASNALMSKREVIDQQAAYLSQKEEKLQKMPSSRLSNGASIKAVQLLALLLRVNNNRNPLVVSVRRAMDAVSRLIVDIETGGGVP